MNTLVNVLNEKLSSLGYNETVRNTAISKLDLSLIENNLQDVDDFSKYIEVYQYEEPCVEIIRAFLNINNRFIYSDVLEGDIQIKPAETIYKARFVAADYSLFKRSAVITISNDFKIKIYVYSPTSRIQILYDGKTYEDIYKKERDSVSLEYKEAFEGRRLQDRKIEELLTMLVSDYIIDEMIVCNLNPRVKIYDDPDKYSENITTYSLRFINNKTNRIEIFEKEPNLRRIGSNVIAGVCSNDPYIRLSEMPIKTDFPLKMISYYWVMDNGRRQEEIAIYVATKNFEYDSYAEARINSPAVKMVIDDVSRALKRTEGISTDYSAYVGEVIKSLNIELVNPPIKVIRDSLGEQADSITPILYRYKFITSPEEFEEKLYISVEDNIGRNYKYKISEDTMEDLTRVGTKLEYTNESGELVRRQSVADFNVNAPTAVIRKETFIDSTRIQNLIGYIYHDENESKPEKLPIPSLEVYIYIPKQTDTSVCMFNGTSLEFTLDGIKGNDSFSNGVETENKGYIEGGTALPGTTYVTVKYVNSKDEVLKENKIGNQYPGSKFLPDLIPIINDVQGKEWRAELTRMDYIIVNANPELNVVKIKYVEKYTRVTFSFMNREGRKIAEDKQELIQVGEVYDFESKKNFITSDNDEWHLKFSRPSKFIAKESEEKNKVILVYDIERTEVLIKYINRNTNEELADSQTKIVAAGKKFAVDVPKYLLTKEGLGYNYIEGTDTNIFAMPNITNEVNLYYDEAKVPVVVSFKNESGIKIIDDKVELIQIGKKYFYNFDDEITDFQGRKWSKKKTDKEAELVIDANKEKNILECIYEPVLASVVIKFVNTDNRPIKSDNIEKAQLGDIFNSASLDEIIDNYQRAWKCVDKGNQIVVKSQESENVVVLKYEPLMTILTIKYLDAELNELMESKQKMVQVGSVYKDRPIEKFESKDGKHWKINLDNIQEVVAKKYEEENVISIYYEKETAKVTLSFYDAYNNELKVQQEVEAQIGATLDTKVFEKITDNNNVRWMLESSEPKNLVIKANNNFIKLIYGEIKAKVLVKHIDVKTGKPIIDNLLTTVKLGGIYMPSIQTKVLDKNKYHWKYIGEENISIVTKENEQENIIVLNYEEDTAKVILKYKNQDGEIIRPDSTKDVQIGKAIRIDPILKFADSTGLVWKYHSIKIDNANVVAEDNYAYATYEPVMADIKIRFVDDSSTDIVNEKIIKLQEGKPFVPEIVDRITDADGKVWVYSKISEEKIIVKENSNEILMTFEKLMSNVSIQLVDMDGELIAKPNEFLMQVGDVYKVPFETNYTDMEDKAWIFNHIDKESLNISEQSEKNVVKVSYEKELVNVQIKYFNILNEKIRNDTNEKAQIGSIYVPKPYEEIIDEKTKLGWKLPENYNVKYKVKREENANIIEVKYEILKVKVTVRYKEKNDAEIIEETLYSEQVGTTFKPKIEPVVIDNQDREWLYGIEEEAGFFGNNKKKEESVFVDRDESKNYIDLKYRPSLIKVTIKYQEPLGKAIVADRIVDAQIGSIYEAEIIDTIIDNQKVKWVYNPNSTPTLKVTREEKDNIVIMAYEEEKALVTYKYSDEYGNRLRSPKRKLVQIGSTYEPEIENITEDYQGRVWEYKSKSTNKLQVKEDEAENIIEVVYAPLKVDAILRFVNLQGKQILKDSLIKAQLGSEFAPDINEKITDDDSKLYKFVRMKPEALKIKEVPVGALETPNVFELTYEAVYSDAIVKYKTIDGKKIKEDDVKQLQVGTIFDPVPAQFVKDENGIQWELISNEIDSIRVMEDARENIVSMVYEVAKAEVTIRYKDMDGNNILKSNILQLEVGKEFIPEIEKEVIDEQNRKWVFFGVEPVKLTVGSINNIINVTYQEKKVQVIVKCKTKDGKTIKEDSKMKAQVGTRFEPRNTTRVIYDENEIWRFAYNDPSIIVVSENISENLITQIYTKEERKVEEQNENKTYYNPEIEKFIDKELVTKEQEIEEQKELKEQETLKEQVPGEVVELEDDNLKMLTRGITLTNDERTAINKLNGYNAEIIDKLNDALSNPENIDFSKLEDDIIKLMCLEKQMVQEELNGLIENDRSGKLILKIFEAITKSEEFDKNWSLVQQRRAISVADYFVNRQISDEEQAIYICEKGKVEKELECVDNQILTYTADPKKNRFNITKKDLINIKIKLIYEKIILNNYNKARSTIKDDYFKDNEAKNLLPPTVIVIIANTLPKQAYRLLTKYNDLKIEQEIELTALMKLMNTQQIGTLTTMVEKIPDGKLRKQLLKYLKEF